MIRLKEEYLCKALDKFKEMIHNEECSKADIAYFYNLSKYELGRRGTAIDRKEWLTKKEASQELQISSSTFDRLVQKGLLPKGKKVLHQHGLIWNIEAVEQLKREIFLSTNC